MTDMKKYKKTAQSQRPMKPRSDRSAGSESPHGAGAPEESGSAETAAETAAAQPTPTPEDAEDLADTLAQDNEALRDRLLRLQADFENFRKRTQRERGELVLRANEDLVGDLLPILDYFELGFHNAEAQGVNDSVVEGFRLVYDQMTSVLKRFGLEPLDAEGAVFDPHHHEAVTQIPSNEVPAERVITQTRRGYRLGDRLLRASQVVVSSGPPTPPPEAEGEDRS